MKDWKKLMVDNNIKVELPQDFIAPPNKKESLVLGRFKDKKSGEWFFYVNKKYDEVVYIPTYKMSKSDIKFWQQILNNSVYGKKNKFKIIIERKNGKIGMAVL